MFFGFPWNNFLHSIVYDLIHQVLTGRIDLGYNRELTVSLFRDARLMHRIIEGSKRNDEARFVRGVWSVVREHSHGISVRFMNIAHSPKASAWGTWAT